MAIDGITATEFLRAAVEARANDKGKSKFERILKNLTEHPNAKERLVFDLLRTGSEQVQSGTNPAEAILWISRWRTSIGQQRLEEYLSALENTVLKYFEFLVEAASGRTVHPWVLALAVGVGAIKDLDRVRYFDLMETLQRRSSAKPNDYRSNILAEARKIVNTSKA
jgi:hypothetical protein